MYRTHTCGELRIENVGQTVTLAGWVQKSRKLGGMTFVDLRDRYGITQLVVDAHAAAELVETAASLGREWVLQVTGEVIERQSKNPKMPTGDIEISLSEIRFLTRQTLLLSQSRMTATAVRSSEQNIVTSIFVEIRFRERSRFVIRSLTRCATISMLRTSSRSRLHISSSLLQREHVTLWFHHV